VHGEHAVGIVESLVVEARGSRPPGDGRSLLGHARLNDGAAGDRAWHLMRTGGLTGIRLALDAEPEAGGFHALHAVRLCALDDADDPRTRVISTWESPDVRSG
jgi:hypothetical protein